MDFSLTDDQQAIADLAQKILTDKATNERQREIEQSGTRFDPELWQEVAKAGLLGIPVPEDQGGSGLGFLELAAILEQVGRTTAPIPILETLLLAAMPIAEFGNAALQELWLPRVAKGEVVLSAALVGDAPVTGSADGDGWRLSGVRLFVPSGASADAVLVPAETDAPGRRFT